MTENWRCIYDQYVLELLAEGERRHSEMEQQIRVLNAFAEATVIKLSDLENEVERLREVCKKTNVGCE